MQYAAKLKILPCNYLDEKGLDSGSVEVVLAVFATAAGLFVCPVCTSVK